MIRCSMRIKFSEFQTFKLCSTNRYPHACSQLTTLSSVIISIVTVRSPRLTAYRSQRKPRWCRLTDLHRAWTVEWRAECVLGTLTCEHSSNGVRLCCFVLIYDVHRQDSHTTAWWLCSLLDWLHRHLGIIYSICTVLANESPTAFVASVLIFNRYSRCQQRACALNPRLPVPASEVKWLAQRAEQCMN